jgi:membrane protein DedA with SNARE-associated domain
VDEIARLISHVEQFIRDYGVVAVSVLLALESLGLPLPGETVLIFASVLAGRGDMSLPALLVFAWAGSVVGDNIGYLIGRKLGRAAVSRYGARVGLTAPRFDTVEATFARYGAAAVVFARFVNVLRQLNGIVAGTLGMEWRRFLACNALGAALWVALWVLGAFYLGAHMSAVAHVAHRVGIVGAVAVAAVLLAGGVYLWRRRSA